MISELKIRQYALTAQSLLTIVWGVALLYLQSFMTNWFFEAMGLTVVLLLSEAALILASANYGVAALFEGSKHRRRILLYSLMGLVPLLTALILLYFPALTIQQIVFLAAAQALLSGVWSMIVALRIRHHPDRRIVLILLGAVSMLLSAALVLVGMREIDPREGTIIVGSYLCFAGLRLYLFAAFVHRRVTLAEKWHPAR